jgi:hypothetical protein
MRGIHAQRANVAAHAARGQAGCSCVLSPPMRAELRPTSPPLSLQGVPGCGSVTDLRQAGQLP